VKRSGKDRNDAFWSFGKIHGLENIAFADPEEIRQTNGNPVKIQEIVNKYNNHAVEIDSYEHLTEEIQKSLKEYKETVDSMGLNPSDRKKLLGLPFYLSKRH
jgi:tRNA/tmRNA/rRNA uracil-C5-methylase (TrmA/RlmC/RlmD family)